MAQTFLGRLVLSLQDNMSGKAKTTAASVNRSLNSIERSAKQLGGAAWGAGFQQQLNKLGASRAELNQINTSWMRLQNTIKANGLNKALAGSEIRAWKTATLSHLSQVRAGWRETERSARRTARTMREAFTKPVLVAMGGYHAGYAVGVGARAAMNAASKERREEARQHFAGLPQSEQDTISTRSQELSAKYRVSQAEVMELMREARLAMPSAEAAFKVAEELVQAYKMLGVTMGSEQALSGLRAFNKGLDNIGTTEDSALYAQMLDSYIKAQQITGADMDPEAFRQAIKYARTSGKVFSAQFLQDMVPFLIAESGGQDTGNQLRATYDTFLGRVTTKKALDRQTHLGLRGKDGAVTDRDLFVQDPIEWIHKNIVPALEKQGIDIQDAGAVGEAVSGLASNRLAKDFLMRAIMQRDIYRRLADMMKGAVGLEGAADVDALDPFSAFKGFKDAMSNLSAAVLPMEGIVTGLNSFSDTINRIRDAYKDGDPLAKAGVIGTAAVGVGAPAFVFGKAIYGLMTAGTNLNLAATALQRAAAMQAGGDLLDGKGGKVGKAVGVMGWLAAIGKAVGVGGSLAVTADALGDTPGGTMSSKIDSQMQYRHMIERIFGVNQTTSDQVRRKAMGWDRDQFSSGAYLRELRSTIPSLNGGSAGVGLSDVVNEARKAGTEVQSALSVDVKPKVDLAGVQALRREAEAALSVLKQLGSAVAGAQSSLDAEMRRTTSDYGVAP